MVKQLYYPSKIIFRERSSFNRPSKRKVNRKETFNKCGYLLNTTEFMSSVGCNVNVNKLVDTSRLQNNYQSFPHTPFNNKMSTGANNSKYASAKFTAPPEPSCVPLPPLHWRQQSLNLSYKRKCLEMSLYLKSILQVP